jgi:hypothetical protein
VSVSLELIKLFRCEHLFIACVFPENARFPSNYYCSVMHSSVFTMFYFTTACIPVYFEKIPQGMLHTNMDAHYLALPADSVRCLLFIQGVRKPWESFFRRLFRSSFQIFRRLLNTILFVFSFSIVWYMNFLDNLTHNNRKNN